MTNQNGQASKMPENGPDLAGHEVVGNSNTAKSDVAKLEEEVLNFWQVNKIFEKSLEKDSPKGEYVFYDGPPFATGLPHYGHILAGTIKDVIPRYQTMRGFRVERRWGWDCHGVPIENLIQQENNLKTKKDIENFGIKNFNEAARASVFRYDEEWRKVVPRTGRWVDMDNKYTTMDSSFSESVMWSFKKLYDKGLIYEGFKSIHISPLLETPLSNFEAGQAYKDIVDISVYVMFELLDESNTFMLAWTTTPWTLPGNVALAIGKGINYVKVKHNFEGEGDKYFIVAKSLVEKVFKDKEYEIVEEIKPADLIGKSYKPPFDYYLNKKDLENYENGWKIYEADFVNDEDGTGIAHEAPAFGEDDYKLLLKNNLPFVQHVNIDGTIKPEVTDFAGLQAKPKSTKENPTAHQSTDIEVIKKLAGKKLLFAKEKITHSYPHCPRTDAPLLNYALSSWFVKVTNYANKMIEANKKINWIPDYVGSKRFGNWLENIKDWGISRSRFWGTPIPIWRSDDGEEIEVLGSLEEIKSKTKSTNNYILLRHGESDHNIKRQLSADDTVPSKLTEKGRNDIVNLAEKLKSEKIDLIFHSPLMRTTETAKLFAQNYGLSSESVLVDDRLKEIQTGNLNGQDESKYHQLFENKLDRFSQSKEKVETLNQIKQRVGDFIYEIDQKYQDKNILIISHDAPLWMFEAVRLGSEDPAALELLGDGPFLAPGQYRAYDFAPIPHDDNFVLDFHRPYIDEITFSKNQKLMKRVPDVFDTWFDSGSMPYAINHYPFEKDNFDPGSGLFGKSKGFPADFIAEGLDQTRGWFYTLLALGVGLFDQAPYQNVIVNGLVLAEDGNKMSKRLKNYPPLDYVTNKYGMDAMRYYMISSPIVRSEPLNFSEKGVDEIIKKITNRLLNVVTFYEMYALDDFAESDIRPKSDNVLDEWILTRLSETAEQITEGMEKYELDKASRPLLNFVDDLSTWYLRRSRDRFKAGTEIEKNLATKTLAYVLLNTSKLLAPFMPFLAENVYQRVTGLNFSKDSKSVHLLDWPQLQKAHHKVLEDMALLRQVVADSLEARDQAGIRVRQPLQALFVSEKNYKKLEEMASIIKDEVNVKELTSQKELKDSEVKLNLELSEELVNEGIARELIRFIQSMRKGLKLDPEDSIEVTIMTDVSSKISSHLDDIKKVVNAEEIHFADNNGEEMNIDDNKFKVSIQPLK